MTKPLEIFCNLKNKLSTKATFQKGKGNESFLVQNTTQKNIFHHTEIGLASKSSYVSI